MRLGIGAAALLAAIVAANIMLAYDSNLHGIANDGNAQRLAAFIVTVVSLVLLLTLIGRAINGRPAGVVIDNRNRVSLSKLQVTAWTVLIISGLVTAAAIRMQAGDPAPLAITIGPDLLIVMGISAASMVATPAILSLKTQEPANAQELLQAVEVGDVSAVGKVHGRPDPEQASWADIFRGDEVGNANAPDLGKIQQFLITGLLLAYYAILLGQMCWDGIGPPIGDPPKRSIDSLPDFDASMVWLLGISHAGYLGYKAAPHSRPAAPLATVEEVG